MKHISIKIKFGLAAALLASACTNELSENPTDDARAITFAPLAETRAAVDGEELPSNSSFKVWGGYDNNVNNVFNGVTVTESNGSWSYSGTQYWLPGKEYNFWGVYPANLQENSVTVTSDGNITIENFDASQNIDIMTATAPKLPGTEAPTVKMNFQHELARVKISVESNGATVSELKVYSVGYQGSFNSGDNPKWNVSGTAKENSTPFSNSGGLDMLLIPATDLTNAKLKVTYHYGADTSNSRTDEKTLEISGGWTAGKQYHYKVSIVAGKLTITVTVVDWTEKDTSVSW